jgi:predicted nucleic acid-binding protein
MKQMLDLYSDYLLASFSQISATGLSNLMNGEVSHDQVTRFLSQEKKTSKNLWLIVKPFVKKIQSEQGVSIIDDLIEEKPYTYENEIVCWHYDHSKRGRITLVQATAAIEIYERISIKLVDVDLKQALEIVDKHKVYANDAYMITCALNRGCPLLTLDGGLACAAKAAGVEVWEAN